MGDYVYNQGAAQLRLVQEGPGTVTGTVPPRTNVFYILVGPGAPASGGEPGGGGIVLFEEYTAPALEPVTITMTVGSSNTTFAADGTIEDEAGTRPAAVGNPGTQVNLWQEGLQLFAPDGELNANGVRPPRFGQGGDFNPPDGAVDTHRPGAAYLWISTVNPVIQHTATVVSALRLQGKTDGLLTDIPAVGGTVPPTGLTWSGQPAPASTYETYKLTLPWLDPATGAAYVTDEAPNGDASATGFVQACLHPCVSPLNFLIVMVRFASGGNVIMNTANDVSLVSAPEGFEAVQNGGATSYFLQTTGAPPAFVSAGGFARFVFSSDAPVAQVVSATNASGDVLASTLGEHAVYTSDGLFVTGQRKQVVTVLSFSTPLRTRSGAAYGTFTPFENLPRTPALQLFAEDDGDGDAVAATLDIAQEYPLRGTVRGAVLVNAVQAADGGAVSYSDPYGLMHIQDVFAAAAPLPFGAQVLVAPAGNGAPGVTVQFQHPLTLEPIVISTVDSVAPRQARTGNSSETWTLVSAVQLLRDSGGTLPDDAVGVVLRNGRNITGSDFGRPRLSSAFSDAAGEETVGLVPTVRPDHIAAALRDPDDPGTALRVYDAQFGRKVYALGDSSITHTSLLRVEFFTPTGATVDFGNGLTSLLPGTLGTLAPGEIMQIDTSSGDPSVLISVNGVAVVPTSFQGAAEHTPDGSTISTFALEDVDASVNPIVQSQGPFAFAVQSAPRGVSYLSTPQVSVYTLDRDNYSPAGAPFQAEGPSLGADVTPYTNAAGERTLRVVFQGDTQDIRVTALQLVDGVVYDVFMTYDGDVEPLGGAEPEDAAPEYPVLGKYQPAPGVLRFLGLIVLPQTAPGQVLDRAGQRHRIPGAAYAALAYMVGNPASTTGGDIAFAFNNGCPEPLLAVLRLLPTPVPDAAYESARTAFGVAVRAFVRGQI
uniref:Uncharacterized protein n=1 Tax=viral metagenome TaxID=1070528 RepID=A0A6C0AUH5_9ZZZZ